MIPSTETRTIRHRPVVFLGFEDMEPFASVFEYHMGDKTYVNTKFKTMVDLFLFAKDYLPYLEPRTVFIYISAMYWCGPIERQGYHVVKPIDPHALTDIIAKLAAYHEFSMCANRDRGLEAWPVYFMFADTPHLRRLSDYHRHIHRLFPRQFPDYSDTLLPGRFYNSDRTVHARMRLVYDKVSTRCPNFNHVKFIKLYHMGPERLQLDYSEEITRQRPFPLITTFRNCWYHDGVSPNSLGFIVFRFTFAAIHSITTGDRPDGVNASYNTVHNFLRNYEREVLDFTVPRRIHREMFNIFQHFC